MSRRLSRVECIETRFVSKGRQELLKCLEDVPSCSEVLLTGDCGDVYELRSVKAVATINQAGTDEVTYPVAGDQMEED